MLGLPSPYILGAAALLLLGSHTAVWLKATSAANGRWEAVRAVERADAMRVQLDAEKRAREAENRAAEAAIDAEESHAKAIADIAASSADFDERLRRATRPRRCDSVSSASTVAGVPENTPSGSDSGPGQPDFESGRRLRSAVKALQAYAVSCQGWAAGVGR